MYPGNIEPAALGCATPMPKQSSGLGNKKQEVIGPFLIPQDPPGYFERLANRARQHA